MLSVSFRFSRFGYVANGGKEGVEGSKRAITRSPPDASRYRGSNGVSLQIPISLLSRTPPSKLEGSVWGPPVSLNQLTSKAEHRLQLAECKVGSWLDTGFSAALSPVQSQRKLKLRFETKNA